MMRPRLSCRHRVRSLCPSGRGERNLRAVRLSAGRFLYALILASPCGFRAGFFWRMRDIPGVAVVRRASSRIVGVMKKSEALKILGLADGASDDEIKKAHRKLVIAHHPDKFPLDLSLIHILRGYFAQYFQQSV